MTMEANLNVPKGFRFLPTKKELFYFLWQKISGQQPSCGEYAIGELDVYNEEQLEEVFLKGEREDCPVYMFTRLKFKGKIRNKNKDRKVGKGTWKTQQHGKLEGFGGWRDFRYVDSGCKRRHHQWNMTEFFLDEKQYPDVQDCVISCVKRKYTKARDQEENECIDQFTEQEECECKDQIMEQEKEEESSADDSFAEYLNGVLMSPMRESETVAIPIPQPHHETMQRAINNTDPYIVPALVEELLQIATSNTDTNIVSVSIEEAKLTPSTPAGDQSNNLFAEAEKVLQSDDQSNNLFAKAEKVLQSDDQSNNLFAEAEKVLQSDDLSSMSWIDEMFDNDNVHEFEPLLLLDEENGFSTCYNY